MNNRKKREYFRYLQRLSDNLPWNIAEHHAKIEFGFYAVSIISKRMLADQFSNVKFS